MQLEGKIWGTTTKIFQKNNVEVHHIFVNKGGYCSKHYHKAKYNKFIVNKGQLKVGIDRSDIIDSTILKAGMDLTVNPGDIHWFEALEDTEALEVYWVELDGPDITRITVGGKRE